MAVKTHEKGDEPVRYMANHQVGEIVQEATTLLLEMTRPDADDFMLDIHIMAIERLLGRVRFNLQKPKPK